MYFLIKIEFFTEIKFFIKNILFSLKIEFISKNLVDTKNFISISVELKKIYKIKFCEKN